MKTYPEVLVLEQVGNYRALAKSGGGYVWDEVLEYRVWCHPQDGAPDLEEELIRMTPILINMKNVNKNSMKSALL